MLDKKSQNFKPEFDKGFHGEIQSAKIIFMNMRKKRERKREGETKRGGPVDRNPPLRHFGSSGQQLNGPLNTTVR